MKNWIIISLICITSCTNKDGRITKLIYNEGSLKAYVFSTPSINETDATKRLDSILTAASNDSTGFRQTVSFLELPFSNPNSYYRNQNLFSKLLQVQLLSPWYDMYEKQAAAANLKLLQQNNTGNPANDFTYITPDGVKKRMYDIQSNYTLIFFNNPECYACKEVKAALAASPIISSMFKKGKLIILAVYTDKDEKLWLDHLNEYPSEWIQGRDDNEYLYKNRVYDLKAIPSVYLLNSKKNVLLKDCFSINKIEDSLKLN